MASDKTINQLEKPSALSDQQLFLIADPSTGKMFQASVSQLKSFVGVVSGANGKDAYELALDAGFTGTLEQWLESLRGEKGEPGDGGTSIEMQQEPCQIPFAPVINIYYDDNLKNYQVDVTGSCIINLLDSTDNDTGTIKINIIGDGTGWDIVFNAPLLGILPQGINISYVVTFTNGLDSLTFQA